jgi:hypothetical protein
MRNSVSFMLPLAAASLFFTTIASPALAQEPPATAPTTPEPATVAPASDPAHASAETREGKSVSEPPVPARQLPALGGHLGFALPIVTFGDKTTAIGADFATVGVTPGITVHLDDKWAVDFEFIAFNEVKNTPATTTFIVDPGVIRKFDGFVLGGRVATQVGAPTNIGLVPIFVLPIKISEKAVYFFEADIPLFLRDTGTKMQPSATFLFQSGFGF